MKSSLPIMFPFMALVCTVSLAQQPEGPPGCGDRGLLFAISAETPEREARGAIPLKFVITNTSKDSVHIPVGLTCAEFDQSLGKYLIGSGVYVICQRSDGEFLKFKGSHIKASGPGKTLQAGKRVTAFTLDLAKCFDLAPGTYDVQLLFTRRYSGFADAASNRVTISVEGTQSLRYQLLPKDAVYEGRERTVVYLEIGNYSEKPIEHLGYGFVAEGFRIRNKQGTDLRVSEWVGTLRRSKRAEEKISIPAKSKKTVMYLLDQLVREADVGEITIEWKKGENSAKPIVVADPKF